MPNQYRHPEPKWTFSWWKIGQHLLLIAFLISASVSCCFAQERGFKPLQRNVKVLSTNLHGFGIPFAVSDQSGQFIEVQLYLSTDLGKTWSFHSKRSASENEFPFSADGDGEYWFAIKTLDRNRRLLPDGDAQPELKIVVDTKKPELDFRVESDAAGRVVCRWQVSDADLKIDSFAIEYRAGKTNVDQATPFKTVPVKLAAAVRNQTWSDQLAWWPDTTEQNLEVRMQISDNAGNKVSASRHVATRPTTWRKRSSGSTLQQVESPFVKASPDLAAVEWQPKFRPVVEPVAVQKPAPSSPDRWRINETADRKGFAPPSKAILPAGVKIAALPTPTNPQSNRPVANSQPPIPFSHQRLAGAPSQRGGAVEWESTIQDRESVERSFSATTMTPTPSVAPIAEALPRRSTDSLTSNPSTQVRSGKNLITESTTSWPDNQWNGPPAVSVPPQMALAPKVNRMVAINRGNQTPPPPSISNARKVAFRRLPKFDSSAPSTSVLNNRPAQNSSPAQQMRHSPQMPDSANTQIISTKRFNLNYDIDAIDPSGVGRVDLWMTRDRGRTWKIWGQDPDNVSPFPVEVSQEGIYGFRIVVRSKDGLAGRGPMQGEEADMWIQVDVTAPLVKITSVPYGRGSEVGHLVVDYAVADTNLALRPNALQWSTHPDGPWTVIEKDLRNDGRYVWKPGQNVPHRIFLKLAAIDRAGNVGVHLLEKAIDLSGLTPRGTIFGVDPVGR